MRLFSGGSSLHAPDFLEKGYGVIVVLSEDNSCGLRCFIWGMCADVKRRNLLKAARASQLTKEVEALALSIWQSTQDPIEFTDFDKKSYICTHNSRSCSNINRLAGRASFKRPNERLTSLQSSPFFWDVEQSHYHFINSIRICTNDHGYHHKWCVKCKKFIPKEYCDSHACVERKCKCCTTRLNTNKELVDHMPPKQ